MDGKNDREIRNDFKIFKMVFSDSSDANPDNQTARERITKFKDFLTQISEYVFFDTSEEHIKRIISHDGYISQVLVEIIMQKMKLIKTNE